MSLQDIAQKASAQLIRLVAARRSRWQEKLWNENIAERGIAYFSPGAATSNRKVNRSIL